MNADVTADLKDLSTTLESIEAVTDASSSSAAISCSSPTSSSRLRSSSSGTSISSVCSRTGTTSTAANEVCRRPWLSNGEIRTSRCVPCSTDSVPYANGAWTWNVADLIPASSA